MIFFDVSRDELMRRLTGRRVCRQCGTAFHLVSAPRRRPAGATSAAASSTSATTTRRPRWPAASTCTRRRPRPCSTTTASAACWRGGRRGPGRRRGRPIRRRSRSRWRVILLKSARELAHMRRGGTHPRRGAGPAARTGAPGISTKEIDADVEAFIVSRGAPPGLQGLPGLPATVCISINEEVVHGIPSPKRKLREGDIVGLDLGCIVEGYYADCAITLAGGHGAAAGARSCSTSPAESLDKAIVQCRRRQPAGRRVARGAGARARATASAVVRAFVGHGIGRSLHEEPQIPNFGDAGTGPGDQGGHGAGHRADGHHGLVGGAHARGRLDGGDRRRQPGPRTSSTRSRSPSGAPRC